MARMLHLAGFSFNRFTRIAGVAAIGLAVTGCVSQDKYNALKLDRDGLAEQLSKSQSDSQSAQAAADSYKTQLTELMNNNSSKDGIASNLQQQLAAMQTQYDDLNHRYADAMQHQGTTVALPPALTSELQTFANQHPELVDFDAARGIVKFKSDVTFGAGDATLSPAARGAIVRFAEILNSPAANGYELMVAGHTDNQRVSNPRTIAAGNKDNWYLSCHRAISVGDELIASHVSPNRLAMVGYADQRPAAANTSAAGQAANRRVEILILPTQVHGAAVAASDTIAPRSARRSTPAARGAVLNKDSISTAGPVLNK